MKRLKLGGARLVRAAFLFVFVICAFGVVTVLFHPDSPLPDHWHPLEPLSVTDPITPLTGWKYSKAQTDPEICLSTLSAFAQIERLDDKFESENCGISPRVTVSSFGVARLDTIETACPTALATAMWEHHGIQPLARELLGSPVSMVRQIGSYNCRMMRTSSGDSSRWSTHARALAIDVVGFDLEDGRKIRLRDDWEGETEAATFLHAVRDDACRWFGLTLSPDFNALHADHFHLQTEGWGGCR